MTASLERARRLRLARGWWRLALTALLLLPAWVRGQEAVEQDWAALAAARLPLLAPCTKPNIEEGLLCGTIEVWENRDAAEGRKIGLNIVVVPAQSLKPPADPVFVFEGGPGGAATKRAASSVWSGPVRQRDIVLVDQRGTGASAPITCDLGGGRDTDPGELREMFPVEDVRECAERLARTADLSQYTTARHADDIEEIRRLLGYGRINLRGGSYGTDAMMTFAQRHPTSVRTMFGIGMNSPTRSNLSERGPMTERALGRLGQLCASDPGCAELTPDLKQEVGVLLHGLEGEPLRVAVPDPQQPEVDLDILITRDWMAEMMRLNLYFAYTSNALPWAVHRAGAGDWQPLTQLAVLIGRTFRSTLSYGVLLTVQCSEFMDFDLEAARERGSRTLFGNYRLEQQVQGCSAWPHRQQPRLGVPEMTRLEVPALFLSGRLDPVTPPDYAEEARQIFPVSRHVVLEQGQHGPFDLEESWVCVHQLWGDLLRTTNPEAIDTTCVDKMVRPPFVLDEEAFDTYMDEVLLPWSG